MSNHIVSIDVSVFNEDALFVAALRHAINTDGVSADDALGLLRPEGVIDVPACLTMLLDPGAMSDGAEINSTQVESF